jgi:hypothetical protein
MKKRRIGLTRPPSSQPPILVKQTVEQVSTTNEDTSMHVESTSSDMGLKKPFMPLSVPTGKHSSGIGFETNDRQVE